MPTACRAELQQVNFLLSNQQDKAVDLFLDMLKEDTGPLRLISLGNLVFAYAVKVDRAIRIHQTSGGKRH